MSLSQGIVSGVAQILPLINQYLAKGSPLFVFIAGGSCSGKTTLTQELQKSLPQASVLTMDNYFRNYTDPKVPTENNKLSFDKLEAYQLVEIEEHLKRLNQHRYVYGPIYDLEHNLRTNEQKLIPMSNIVIVDGLYAVDIGKGLNLNQITVFVDAPYRIRLMRRIARDQRFASREVVERHFRCQVEPVFQKDIYPQLKIADLVIKNE